MPIHMRTGLYPSPIGSAPLRLGHRPMDRCLIVLSAHLAAQVEDLRTDDRDARRAEAQRKRLTWRDLSGGGTTG